MNEIDVLERLREGVAPATDAARSRARGALVAQPRGGPLPGWHVRRRQDDAERAISRHAGRRFAVALVAVSVLVGAAWVAARARVHGVRPQHTVAISSAPPVAPGAPEVFLLVGSDERSGDPAVTGKRSDTILAVRVEPATRHVLVVSIPRDLWVAIPGVGTGKIDSAYSHDISTLVETVRQTLGVPVDHIVITRFDSFAALVDELGGIRVEFPAAERDRLSGLSEGPGCQTLDGARALSFVRSRHTQLLGADGVWHDDPTGDFGRMRRQQLALRQMLAAARRQAGPDPAPLLRKLDSHLIVDQAFSTDDALRLVAAFSPGYSLELRTLPATPLWVDRVDALELGPGARDVLAALAGRASLPQPSGDSGTPPPRNGDPERPC